MGQRLLDAAADTDRARRSARFTTVFEQLSAESAAELAPRLWEREKASPFQNDWYDFLRRWVGLDVMAALSFARGNAGGQLEDWLLAIVPVWAKLDPQAAARWWVSTEGPGHERIGSALIEGWAEQDWQAAAQWVELNIKGTAQNDLALALATRAVAQDPQTVQAKIDSRSVLGGSPTVIENALFVRTAGHRFDQEAGEAIPWLAGVRGTFPCSRFIASDCEKWLMAYPDRFLSADEEPGGWLSWLTEGQLEPDAMPWYDTRSGSGVILFKSWLASDSESASQWLLGQRDRPCYETFASTLVLTVAEEAPEAAAAWAVTVKSDEMRQQLWNEWRARGLPIGPQIAAAMQRDGAGMDLPIEDPAPVVRTVEAPQ